MLRLIAQSLRHYWRLNLGVLCGIALASAALTGALLVGDSVDYSLQTFARMRLGGIQYALDARNQLVAQSLATRLSDTLGSPVAPVLQLSGMAIYQGDTPDGRSQVNKVAVHGVDASFWTFGNGGDVALAANETAINTRLAKALGVREGDEVSLRVLKPSLMARDSPLSWRSDDRSRRGRYTVKRIVSDDAMGRFARAPAQSPPYNAFVNLADLQDKVDVSERVNLLLAGSDPASVLENEWRIEDIGLHLREHADGMVQLESDRVFLGDESANAAQSLPDARGTLTYLATSLAAGDRLSPYFFAVAGPVPDDMPDDEIVLNRWMADQLDVAPGDDVTLTYAVVMPDNSFEERTRAFAVHSVREMADLSIERALMPVFPGLSDVERCSEWDVGMPMDETLLNDEANEAYWETYRETPKAFVTLSAGQEMWANRFGSLTAVRFPNAARSAAQLREELRAKMDPAKSGLFFVDVRAQADAAVSQAMDFGGLFLGMSFFLIVSALVLTGLLFVFGAQQRARQIGILMAVGYPLGTIRRLLLGEGILIAVFGSLIGAGLGVLYTRALIYGLSEYWQGATADARILYHATPETLIVGATAALVCAAITMLIALRRLSRNTVRDLLHMDFAQDASARCASPAHMRGLVWPAGLVVVAIVMVVSTLAVDATNVAPVFFGAGALLLAAGMGMFHWLLRRLLGAGNDARFGLRELSLLSPARRPGRSVAVAGLLACGCFLVFAVSAMQENLAAHADERASGTGGFALVADSTFPLQENPVATLGIADVRAIAVKVRDGDDASCLNLNQAQTPRLLGVDVKSLIATGAFAAGDQALEMWGLLERTLPGNEIPALVGDSNTAMWTLRKKTGIEDGDVLTYKDQEGGEAPVKLVGQLPMRLSVFQGSVLISQENFTRLFPSEDGHRMFLIDAPAAKRKEVAAELARRFDRYGLDAVPAVERLEQFYAVEETYLAIFLVLGGLGVALGGIGMGVVVMRNLFERRAEIAMLEALGYTRAIRLRVLLTEYGMLLIVGLLIGGVSAAVAMAPALGTTETTGTLTNQIGVALVIIASYAACMVLAVATGLRSAGIDALRNE